MLIDSDVLVWLTRGYVGAAERLHALPWRISAVTYIELAQGCRDKAELARLKKGLAARGTEIVPITPAISRRAAALIDGLALSHGLLRTAPGKDELIERIGYGGLISAAAREIVLDAKANLLTRRHRKLRAHADTFGPALQH